MGEIEARFGTAHRAWVMDRGMASKANLAWLLEGGRRHMIGACRSDRRRLEQKLIETRDRRHVPDDVEVKLCPSPDGEETDILCRPEARRRRRIAIASR